MVCLQQLWSSSLGLISSPRCPLCAGEANGQRSLCGRCLARLALPAGGLQGDAPLLWCALGPYASRLRRLLLRQRPAVRPEVIRALAGLLHGCCAGALPAAGLFVPIPSWKRAANPLPRLLAEGLAEACGGRCRLDHQLLIRRRATVGQHHLNRQQRLGNQQGSFACSRAPARRVRLWLVDDILTTGATAMAAAEVLQRQGWVVEGLLCLGRTPGMATAVI